MNPILDPSLVQLRDIRSLDSISWWPLAPGWWVLVGILAAVVVIGLLIAGWVYVWNQDWRSDARQHLRELGLRAHQLGAKEVAAQLSELLRRVAMARYGRRACASLTGEDWLAWLTAKDPKGFPWTERGRVLIDLPYAPPRDQIHIPNTNPDSLLALVEAVLPWLEDNRASPSSIRSAQTPSMLRIRFSLVADSKRG